MFARFAQSLGICCLLLINVATGQLADAPDNPYRNYGTTVAVRYQVGLSVTASRGAIRDAVGIVAVPFDCDEQEVILVEEDISPEIDGVEYRLIDGGARQMVVTIPHLANGTEAHAILTYEVRTKSILPIDEALTAELVKPKKPDRDLKRYLGRSKYIQHNHSKIRRTLRDIFEAKQVEHPDDEEEDDIELATFDDHADDDAEPEQAETAFDADSLTDWQRVEKIYDFVQQHVKYIEGEDQTALEVLASGQGDCHDVSALFVALCRADKIPARMVWVHEHQYPEFCLADAEGQVHWFPCESTGMRAFGELPMPRVIMQKGDNFRVPERREALRYASEYFIALPVGNGGKPKVDFIRRML